MDSEARASTSFVQQMCDIPLVSSALHHVSTTYQEKKRSNLLAWLTCETCEIGLKVAAVATRPLVGLLEEPIDRLNAVACQGLSHLTSAYPVLSKTSSELMQTAQQQLGAFLLLSPTDDEDIVTTYSQNTSKVDNQNPPDVLVHRANRTGRRRNARRKWIPLPLYPVLAWSYVDVLLIGIKHQLTEAFYRYSVGSADTVKHLFKGETLSNMHQRCTQLFSCATSITSCSRCHVIPAQFSIIYLQSHCDQASACSGAEKPMCLLCFVISALQEHAISFDKTTRLVLQRFKELLLFLMEVLPQSCDCLLNFFFQALDRMSNYPPLSWIVPDVNMLTDSLTARHDADAAAEPVSVRYVPVHPVDLANYAVLTTPRRVYWRRCY